MNFLIRVRNLRHIAPTALSCDAVFQRRELETLRSAADIAVATAQQLSRSVAAKQYLLDGHRFVDIGHVTVQFEHHEQARQIRVIEPVHHLHKEFEALVDDKRLVMPMRQLVRSDEVGLWTAKLNVKSAQCGSVLVGIKMPLIGCTTMIKSSVCPT